MMRLVSAVAVGMIVMLGVVGAPSAGAADFTGGGTVAFGAVTFGSPNATDPQLEPVTIPPMTFDGVLKDTVGALAAAGGLKSEYVGPFTVGARHGTADCGVPCGTPRQFSFDRTAVPLYGTDAFGRHLEGTCEDGGGDYHSADGIDFVTFCRAEINSAPVPTESEFEVVGAAVNGTGSSHHGVFCALSTIEINVACPDVGVGLNNPVLPVSTDGPAPGQFFGAGAAQVGPAHFFSVPQEFGPPVDGVTIDQTQLTGVLHFGQQTYVGAVELGPMSGQDGCFFSNDPDPVGDVLSGCVVRAPNTVYELLTTASLSGTNALGQAVSGRCAYGTYSPGALTTTCTATLAGGPTRTFTVSVHTDAAEAYAPVAGTGVFAAFASRTITIP